MVLCDSFKGSLSQAQVVAAAERAGFCALSASDGGEGFGEAVFSAGGWQIEEISRTDALGRGGKTGRIFYQTTGTVDGAAAGAAAGSGAVDGAGKKRAIVELAEFCGIAQLREREILRASCASFGAACAHALKSGAAELVLAIGGSASNDCGMGVLSAFGWEFFNASGQKLAPCAASLLECAKVRAGGLFSDFGAEIFCANDVEAPLFGEFGCARVFAAQKGADAELILQLDSAAQNFVRLVADALAEKAATATATDATAATDAATAQKIREQIAAFAHTPGAGAAGGTGFALLVLGAKMRGGWQLFSKLSGWQEREFCTLAAAEGCFDAQSLMGKIAGEVAAAAARKNLPMRVVCGASTISEQEAKTLLAKRVQIPAGWEFELLSLARTFDAQSTQELLQNAQELLEKLFFAAAVFDLLKPACEGALAELLGAQPLQNFARCFYAAAPNRYSQKNCDFAYEQGVLAAAMISYGSREAAALDAAASKLCGIELAAETSGEEYYIDAVATAPKYRRRGHLRALLAVAEQRASEQNYPRLALLAKDAAVYEPLGFCAAYKLKIGEKIYTKMLKALI